MITLEEMDARLREVERQRNNALSELAICAGRFAVVSAELERLKVEQQKEQDDE